VVFRNRKLRTSEILASVLDILLFLFDCTAKLHPAALRHKAVLLDRSILSPPHYPVFRKQRYYSFKRFKLTSTGNMGHCKFNLKVGGHYKHTSLKLTSRSNHTRNMSAEPVGLGLRWQSGKDPPQHQQGKRSKGYTACRARIGGHRLWLPRPLSRI
jgi:hypothetical protein